MLGVMFLYNLIYGNIDSQHLLTRLNFNIPSRRTRNFRPLLLSHCSSTYAQHDPFRVLCSDYNGLYHILSLCSTNNLKSLILTALSVQHSSSWYLSPTFRLTISDLFPRSLGRLDGRWAVRMQWEPPKKKKVSIIFQNHFCPYPSFSIL